MLTDTLIIKHSIIATVQTACPRQTLFVRRVFSLTEQLLNDLWLLSREVYLPLVCISGAEEHPVLDRLLDSMHCLIAATEVLSNHAKVSRVLLVQLWWWCITQVFCPEYMYQHPVLQHK